MDSPRHPVAARARNPGQLGPRSAAFVAVYAPNQVSDVQFSLPSAGHWFGTDGHGRDVFSRVVYGAQISLLVGFVGACVSLVIGVTWGAIAGYCGGRIDSLLMRIVDILYSLPSIIFVIVLLTTLGGWLKQSHFVQQSPVAGKTASPPPAVRRSRSGVVA